MKIKNKITNVDIVLEIFSLCAKIQNKGIAEVFLNYSGHVNSVDIKIHCPKWTEEVEAFYSAYLYVDDKRLQDSIEMLKGILNGVIVLPTEYDQKQKSIDQLEKQLKKLQSS